MKILTADECRPKGSAEPRLNPNFRGDKLNSKLGPNMPRPLVRETSGGAVSVGSDTERRRMAGLSKRFK